MHELEEQKIRLEIKELEKLFFLRPNFVVPAMLGLLSFSVATYNGWFDLQSQRLIDRKEILNWEIKKFEERKIEIEKQVDITNQKNEKLSAQLVRSNIRIASTERSLLTIQEKLEAEIQRGQTNQEEKEKLAEKLAGIESSLAIAENKREEILLARVDFEPESNLGGDEKYDTNNDGVVDDYEWKQKAYDIYDVDDDGCFIIELEDGTVEQHCLNY